MAVTVDKEYLILHCAEFSKESEGRIDDLNATAELLINEGVFGDMTRYARMLYIAHLLKLSLLQGSGNVTAEKVGDLSRSYASPADGAVLSMTSYGVELKKIQRIKARGQLFV